MDDWFVLIPAVVGAVAALVTAFIMLADSAATAATGVSETGGAAADDCGGATTGPAAAAADQQPKSVMKSLMKTALPAAVDPAAAFEAAQQALEDAQRAKLPERLQVQLMGAAFVEPEPRIKVSKVDAALKAKLLGHVARCFEYNTVQGMRVPFAVRDVVEVLKLVEEYLQSEPMLIEDLPFGITVVGDLHGQLYELARIFKHDEKDGKPGWECMKYIFLGNYVDRGRQSLEILMALFSLKALYPDRIFLLRGTHEFLKINRENGFEQEMLHRYDKETAHTLYLCFNGVFSLLSIAAIVQDVYLCVHSGISPHAFTRSNLRSLQKPFYEYEDDNVVTDILWAEPTEGLRGTVFNGKRGSSVHFGLDALVVALNSIGADVLVRGHTNLREGYSIMGCGMCVSLYSCTGTLGGDNNGSVMYIDDDGYYKVSLLPMSKLRVQWERALKRLDYSGVVEEAEKKPEQAVVPGGAGGPSPTAVDHPVGAGSVKNTPEKKKK